MEFVLKLKVQLKSEYASSAYIILNALLQHTVTIIVVLIVILKIIVVLIVLL